MTNFAKRSLAMVLALVMCISLFAGLGVTVSAESVVYRYSGDYIYNWGTRGETATFLSPNAEEFYTDNNITYDELAALDGSSSTSSVPSSSLYKKLAALMKNNHSYETSYDATRNLYQYTDCQGSAKTSTKISSFYSGKEIGPGWDGGSTWNREHTWPNSKGLGGNDENDIMMLRPTSVSENSSRGNKAYGKSSGYHNPNSVSGGKYDLRGDVARIFLYVYVRWGNVNGNGEYSTWGSSGVMESKDVLLEWMEADPVDTWELGRNDSVEAITGTRNVFVDYPELAFLLFNEEIPEMTTPSGEAMTPSFTITPTVNNSAYGSVSLSGTTINATPAKGCEVAGYTLISGEATVVQNGNAFTITATSDCTIQINFVSREAVNVTFIENGNIVSSDVAYVDDVILVDVPTKDLNDGYVFLGWVTDALNETAQKPSVIYGVGAPYTLSQDVTFHALYSRVDTTTTDGNTYELATSLTEGDYLIVADEAAMKADTSNNNNRFNYTDVTIINNHIDTPDALTVWHIAPTADGYYTIFNASTASYAAGKGSNNVITLQADVNDYAKWKITFDGSGNPVFTNLGNEAKDVNSTLRKHSNFGFSLYKESTGTAPCLYEKTTHTVLYSTSMMDCFHTNTKREGQIDATCTESGSTGKLICLDCGSQVEADTPVAATGHKDANSDKVCDNCGGLYSAYEKITTLSAGDTVLLVCESAKTELSSIAYDYGFTTGYDELPNGIFPLTVVPGNTTGTYAFKVGDSYLYWPSSSKLSTSTDLNDNASWQVSFDDAGNAIICNAKDTSYQLQFSNPFFVCDAANSKTAIQLYGLVVVDAAACAHTDTELQNTVTASCTAVGYTGDVVCLNCKEIVTAGSVIPVTEHSYKAVVTEPTQTERGYTTFICSACGDSYVDNYTAPLSAVAQIGNAYYFTVAKALIAAKPNDIITMIADSNEAEAALVIYPGVTLNLGSYTLEADYVISLNGSTVTATTAGTDGVGGKLIVDQDNISLSNTGKSGANAWYVIPVWNNDHYVFTNAMVYNPTFKKYTNIDAGTVKLQFLPYIYEPYIVSLLSDGSSDNDVAVLVRASYMDGDIKVTQEFYYTDPMVISAMRGTSLTASMVGCNDYTDLEFSIAIVTASGTEITVGEYKYDDVTAIA